MGFQKEELYHHGILGQKWGIRRFQNKDGTLTSEGKKHREETLPEKGPSRSEKRIQKYASEYQKQGMTPEQAMVAATKREKVEKVLKIVAGVTVTAAVAYGATKYVQNNFDSIIKKDTSLSRVAVSDTKSVQDAFYAVLSKDKTDVSKYAGLYANQIRKGLYGHEKGTSTYIKEIQALGDIKVASPKNASKVLQELVKTDPDFARDFKTLMLNANVKSLGTYEKFNRQLGAFAKDTDLSRKFYGALSSKGYNAIKDINDSKFSGFMTNKPIIVFNASDKIIVDSVKKLSDKEITRNNLRARADIGAKSLGKALLRYGALSAGVAAVAGEGERKYVAEYMKQHPNSKLSYDDIAKNYYSNGG